MRPFLLWAAVSDWLGGMPPTNPDASHEPPMGVMDSFVLVGVLVLAFWGSIRLTMWLDVKISAHALFRDLHRQLGIGGGPARRHSPRRRSR